MDIQTGYISTEDLMNYAGYCSDVLLDPASSSERQREALKDLAALGKALESIEDLHYLDTDIPDWVEEGWKRVSSEMHTLLVRDDHVAEYWEDRLEEELRHPRSEVTIRGIDIFEFVDWSRVGNKMKAEFGSKVELGAHVYWLF